MICRASSVSGKDVTLSYDLSAGNAEAELDNYDHLSPSVNPILYHTKGFTPWIHADDGGQFEPWNPMSLREQYYATWSDQDFSAAITAVQEKNCVG